MRVRYVGRLAARHLSHGDRALARIVLVPPFPRRYELSAPDTPLCRPGFGFMQFVRAAGKLGVVEREPLADEPSAKITVSHGASRDDAMTPTQALAARRRVATSSSETWPKSR